LHVKFDAPPTMENGLDAGFGVQKFFLRLCIKFVIINLVTKSINLYWLNFINPPWIRNSRRSKAAFSYPRPIIL